MAVVDRSPQVRSIKEGADLWQAFKEQRRRHDAASNAVESDSIVAALMSSTPVTLDAPRKMTPTSTVNVRPPKPSRLLARWPMSRPQKRTAIRPG